MTSNFLRLVGKSVFFVLLCIGNFAHAQTISSGALVGPSGNDNGVDRQITPTELKGSIQFQPDFFSYVKLRDYQTATPEDADLYLGQKKIPFAMAKFKLGENAKMEGMYLIVRTGDSEFDAPWNVFKELSITKGKKVVGKVNASKKSSWQKSPLKRAGLAYYFLTFKNLKMNVTADELVKLTVNASIQTKIKPEVLEHKKNSSETYILGPYSFYFPEMNGMTFKTKSGEKLMLNTIGRDIANSAEVFVNADLEKQPKKK